MHDYSKQSLPRKTKVVSYIVLLMNIHKKKLRLETMKLFSFLIAFK